MYGSQTRRSYLLRLLLLTNKLQNYDRRRQKIPCKTRIEPQGSNKRGVRKKKLDKSEYFRRAARVDRKAQEIERSYMRHRRF